MPLPTLLSAQELNDRRNEPNLQIVDASWFLPGSDDPLSGQCISGAVEFDFSFVKSAPPAQQTPHLYMRAFAKANVNPLHSTVIYDRAGLFSAPRGWWMARQAGFHSVSLLDGGLPAWIKAGLKTETTFDSFKASDLKDPITAAGLRSDNVTCEQVKEAINSDTQIVDARPAARFHGTAPEPRDNMRSGHIPGALSLPFGSLKDAESRLLPVDEIKRAIDAAGIDMDRPIITSCGSGITAAGLVLAFHLLGKDDVSLYSGSWSEWGAVDSGLPIAQ